MSEAIPPIAGYRQQSAANVDRINTIKALEQAVEDLIVRYERVVSNDATGRSALRLQRAADLLELGFMLMVKAIANPAGGINGGPPDPRVAAPTEARGQREP